ncbi:uncharacterized protein LOC111630955 [Centruroides sculpturatus]|uniref:uncharacterized protein LOC111630955 n=1 Tax=Centruroides sculpturatus TaxID=218467 RepID=UPI000C6CE2B4|nr:uncharacterized protein LOC111630955 [Centruroides sculpturatus]
MKTILFLLVVVGIAVVANSEASEKGIKKDVSFDKGKKGSVDGVRGGQNVKDKFNFKKDSSRIFFPGMPSSNPNLVTLLGILNNLNLDIEGFLECILGKLMINLDQCHLQLGSIYLRGDTQDRFGRKDRCDNCGTNSSDPLASMNELCPTLNNITSYLGCILDQLHNLDCLDYIDGCLTKLLECLSIYLNLLFSNEIDCDDLLDFLEYVLKVVGGILDTLLDGSFGTTTPEVPDFCLALGLKRKI